MQEKYNKTSMYIKEVMKDQRKKLGISQQDLAEMADVGITTIKQI